MGNQIMVSKLKNVTGDGNCLFRAIALALSNLSKKVNHQDLRQRTVDYIEKNLYTERSNNKATFASALLDSEINKQYKIKNENADESTQLAATLKQMRVDGDLAGSVAIEAICNIENCNIIRVNQELQPQYIEKFTPDYGNSSDTIRLSYKNRHYQYFSYEINDSELSSDVGVEVNNDLIETASEVMAKDPLALSNDLSNTREKLKQQLLNKDIDPQNYDAVIDVFIGDWISSPINKKNETLEKIIFELNNQDKIFDSCHKLKVNSLVDTTKQPILPATNLFTK